jgi:hypothetical protein
VVCRHDSQSLDPALEPRLPLHAHGIHRLSNSSSHTGFHLAFTHFESRILRRPNPCGRFEMTRRIQQGVGAGRNRKLIGTLAEGLTSIQLEGAARVESLREHS